MTNNLALAVTLSGNKMRHNLSEVFELIKDRRTIYPEQYSERKVHKEIIERLLNTAIWAPTHGKTQPWRFKVFTDNGLNTLATFLSDTYKLQTPEEDYSELKSEKLRARPLKSSVVIAICMERQESKRIPEIEEIEAVACGVQNMQLMATAYGIGAFWSTPKLVYSTEMNTFLNLGVDDKCLGLLYLGYPEIEWPTGQRKPIEYVTEWRDK
jgi:nitroreductase